jgi:tRNA (guanine-N7-)-methyltransferase
MNRSFSLTRNIPCPNIYVKMLPEYKGWIFLEDEVPQIKGRWREVFGDPGLPLDLEIGCGNGFFFEHQVKSAPQRNLLGIEIKYKPLVQTVRRVKRLDLPNGRGLRYHAALVEDMFEADELRHIFIHFPDPWPKLKQKKKRLVQKGFLHSLSRVQKAGEIVDFKTDSMDYFESVEKALVGSPYEVIRHTRDLHRSEWSGENFMTSFEKIFTRKGLPTYYMRLVNRKNPTNSSS